MTGMRVHDSCRFEQGGRAFWYPGLVPWDHGKDVYGKLLD